MEGVGEIGCLGGGGTAGRHDGWEGCGCAVAFGEEIVDVGGYVQVIWQ